MYYIVTKILLITVLRQQVQPAILAEPGLFASSRRIREYLELVILLKVNYLEKAFLDKFTRLLIVIPMKSWCSKSCTGLMKKLRRTF